MVLHDPIYIETLERLLRRTDYLFFIKSVRGIGDFIDPWYLEGLMKNTILASESPFKKTLLLLQMGCGAEYEELSAEIGEGDLDRMIASGIWRREDTKVETNNYIVLAYQGLALLTEINPWYATCTNKNTNVYIGGDSLRLAEHIVFSRGADVLDLCSGTGIQGLLAAKSARRVISVEMNPAAVPVTEFNIHLNHLETVVELRRGNLYDVLKPGEKFDFIYANPPFIPVADGVVYPLCGDGGEDGRMVLDRIILQMPEFLKPGGEAIIFCECLGDNKEVFFDKAVENMLSENGWRGMCVRSGRLGTEHQIEGFLKLTALFNEKLDEEEYKRKIREIYKKLGATYLYNLVYKIDAEAGDVAATQSGRATESGRVPHSGKVPQGGRDPHGGRAPQSGKLLYLDQCNPWTGMDRGEVAGNISVGENKKSFGLFKGDRQISSVSQYTVDVLNLLKKGLSISEIADALYEKSQKAGGKNARSRAAFESQVESISLSLESIGIVRRRER